MRSGRESSILARMHPFHPSASVHPQYCPFVFFPRNLPLPFLEAGELLSHSHSGGSTSLLDGMSDRETDVDC